MQRHFINQPCVYNGDVSAAQLNGDELDKHVVICETPTTRVVVMAVTKEIPAEIHKYMTQCFRVTMGMGTLELHGGDSREPMKRYKLRKSTCVVVPPGVRHRIVNDDISLIPLRVHVIYTKPSEMDIWE